MNAIKLSYELKGIEVPKLPVYKQFKRICIQQDAPLNNWSCGTIALLTTLHLILGCKLPHEIKQSRISRNQMLNFHKALLIWLLHKIPPDLWGIDCLNTFIVDCDPILFKHKIYLVDHGGHHL